MSDELIERLRNPIGFAVLHTDAMSAIDRIEKAEALAEYWRKEYESVSKEAARLSYGWHNMANDLDAYRDYMRKVFANNVKG